MDRHLYTLATCLLEGKAVRKRVIRSLLLLKANATQEHTVTVGSGFVVVLHP